MEKDGTKKRGMGWFRTNSTDVQVNQHGAENTEKITDIVVEEPITQGKDPEQNNKNLFSKENQDKVVLDAILSLENIIKDRQLILYKNKGLEEQLFNANETISRLKQEQMKKDQLLQEKSKEIRILESNLTNKQMNYDQLLEDYKEYQNTSNIEYDKVSTLLETEINKYNKLHEESIEARHQSINKINELEEKIRNLEIENKQYIQQYQRIVDEKSELMKTINDFTQRMSFSFSPKADYPDSQE